MANENIKTVEQVTSVTKARPNGIKVKGDLGDLQIIEEKDISEDVAPIKLPQNLIQSSSNALFENAVITNSENVHIGNNTYFNGDVIIKQIIHTKEGIDNPSYSNTEKESQPSKNEKNNVNYLKKIKFRKCHIYTAIGLGIIILAIVCTVLLLPENDFYDTDISTDNGNSNETLFIVPGHLRIVPRNAWIAQPAEQPLTPLKLPAPWVIIEHTATEFCTTQSDCVLLVRNIQSFHIESRKWSDIGYNFLIGGDGSAYLGRGWDSEGAHTLGYNKYSIGIAFIGTFTRSAPSKHQLNACKNLIAKGMKLGKLAKDFKLFGHRQLMATESPGEKLYEIIKTWPHFVMNYTRDLVPNY